MKLIRTEKILTKKILRSNSGASYLTLAVFGTLLAAVVYSAYNIIPFYYCYFELHNQMSTIIPRADTLTDQQIRQRISKFIVDLDVPAEAKDLKIIRGEHKMKLSLSYNEIFYIKWGGKDYDLHVFHFDILTEGTF